MLNGCISIAAASTSSFGLAPAGNVKRHHATRGEVVASARTPPLSSVTA